MAAITNSEAAIFLSLSFHRDKFPGLLEVEGAIKTNRADTDFVDNKEVVVGATIRDAWSDAVFEYETDDKGDVFGIHLLDSGRSAHYFLDANEPKGTELDLLAMVDPFLHAKTIRTALLIRDVFLNPTGFANSYTIVYNLREEDCSGNGCEKRGPVNYNGYSEWQYFCGGSPRCCP